MFESLKKKFSRTSEKLEEELIEEAEKEDNLQEESGKRFSFFSFGRKKEEKKEEEDESNLIPETTEETEGLRMSLTMKRMLMNPTKMQMIQKMNRM